MIADIGCLCTRITGAISEAIAGGGKTLSKGMLDATAVLLPCFDRETARRLAEQVCS